MLRTGDTGAILRRQAIIARNFQAWKIDTIDILHPLDLQDKLQPHLLRYRGQKIYIVTAFEVVVKQRLRTTQKSVHDSGAIFNA